MVGPILILIGVAAVLLVFDGSVVFLDHGQSRWPSLFRIRDAIVLLLALGVLVLAAFQAPAMRSRGARGGCLLALGLIGVLWVLVTEGRMSMVGGYTGNGDMLAVLVLAMTVVVGVILLFSAASGDAAGTGSAPRPLR